MNSQIQDPCVDISDAVDLLQVLPETVWKQMREEKYTPNIVISLIAESVCAVLQEAIEGKISIEVHYLDLLDKARDQIRTLNCITWIQNKLDEKPTTE